jgi:hypothetical protein
MDYERVVQYRWHLKLTERTSYARRTYRGADGKEAARARDAKALEFHGKFAVLNFPE